MKFIFQSKESLVAKKLENSYPSKLYKLQLQGVFFLTAWMCVKLL